MIKEFLRPFAQAIVRRTRQVRFEDAWRNEPVSHVFGTERGKPIDRYYIESFVGNNTSLIRGRVLEVATSEYSRRYHSGAQSFGILHVDPSYRGATLVGDLTRIDSLPADQYDCFVCTQTFNCVLDPRAAIAGAHRLLAPGGHLVATLAGLTQISRYDMDRWGDFWRFTNASAERLFGAQFSRVRVETFGNVLAAKALLDGVAVEDLPSTALLDHVDPNYQVVIGVVATK